MYTAAGGGIHKMTPVKGTKYFTLYVNRKKNPQTCNQGVV